MLKGFGIALALTACGYADDKSQFQEELLRLKLTIDDASLINGKVVIHSELVNNLNESVTFLPWNTPIDKAVKGDFLFIVDSTSLEKVSYQGILVKTWPAGPSDYLNLDSGATLENSLDISKSYKFCADSQYTLAFSGVLLDGNGNELPFEANEIEFQLESAFEQC